MKKDVLFKKLDGLKKPILVFLLAICTCFASFAQTRQITGKVTASDNGSSLPGVSIKVKGTSTGVITDINGAFKLSVPNNATLVFSYIGYVAQEIPVNGVSELNVKLIPNVNTLNEIAVVAVGYGTTRKKDLTGSVSSVTADQIAKTPVTTLDQALQGRASGVQVTNDDGAPGGGVEVVIRGVGSLGNNNPLYVVDGYPVSGGINTLNPSDIASIDVLKDASATAIYGNRASNGVVIITTKRGGKKDPQVTFDGITSIQARPKTYKVLDAQTWGALANKQSTIDNFAALPEWANPSSLTEADWQHAIYQSGLKQDYNLAIRGGTDKVQTSFSGEYFNQKGIVLGSDYKRYNLSANVDYTPHKWLKSSTSMKYTRGDSKTPLGTGSQAIALLSELPPTLDGGNKLTNQISDGKGNYGFFNPINQETKNWNNPAYTIGTQDQKNLTNYFLGSTSLEATIIDGLKIKTYLGINTNDYSGYYFTPSDTRAQTQYGISVNGAQNFYSQSANNTFEYDWSNTISYTKVFGKHSIDFVGGVEQQENTFRQIGASGTDLPSDALRDLENLPAINAIYGNQATYALASQFARLNYKYDDKYLLTGTVRRDGSSRFAPGHQYGVFPSGSVAWRAKQEDFLKSVDFLSDLKFRASYGQIGNQFNAGLFQYLAQYSPGPAAVASGNDGYPFGKTSTLPGVYQPGLVLTSLPNANLKWETSDQTDIGMDASFLNGSLNLTIDYYDKKSRDFLLNIPVPAQTGFPFAYQNVGSIDNRGIEIGLTYAHAVNDFHYNVGLNITTVTNKLLSLATGENYINNLGTLGFPATGTNNWVTYSRSYVGGPVGEFFGYQSAGIFQTQAEIDALNAKSPTGVYQATGGPKASALPGDRKFVDRNGDGQITAADETSLGSPIPKFYGGLNLDATYKAFDFSLFFYGVYGNKIFDYQARTLESFASTTGSVGAGNISQQYYNNAWTPENHSERYAAISVNDYNFNTRPSDVYVENGSYLRLRSATIGYTIPSNTLKRLSISKLRVFVTGQNLFTITGYKGLDPEIGSPSDNNGQRLPTASGIDVGTYPLSKYYTFGVDVTF